MRADELVEDELSGSEAKSFVSEIAKFHRIQGSPMYHDAAMYVVGELRRMGIRDAHILQFPADGKQKFWTHISTLGWKIQSAELRMVEPKKQLLARFDEIPMSLHTFSTGTPKGGVTVELVDVGTGTSERDYRGKKVKGKIVLATGSAREVHIEAVVKRGAAGVVTDTLAYEFPRVRESVDIPDARSYQGIWPTAENASKVRFGFSLSKRQGGELRGYLEDGKTVRLTAEVDAKLFPGKYDVVTATIKGSSRPDEEVFLIAHLCHPKPGANDNASGSGLQMEIARTITSLIRSGRMKRPARTLRFFWVPETTGTVALLSTHPEMIEKLVAGVNMDMVGEDQVLSRSTLHFEGTPDSLPSYMNDLTMSVIERSVKRLDRMAREGFVSAYRYARVPFSLGSDHAEFVEESVGVPCVSFTQWPDLFYHSSLDTVDKVSEEGLKRIGWIVAVVALEVACADAGAVLRFAGLASSRGLVRIAEAGGKATDEMLGSATDPMQKDRGGRLAELVRHHFSSIEHILEREQKAVRSVMRLIESREVQEFVEMQERALADAARREITRLGRVTTAALDGTGLELPDRGASRTERMSMTLIPTKKFKGSLEGTLLRDFLGEKGYEPYKKAEEKDPYFTRKLPEVLNFADGKRTVCDIVTAVSAEYSPTDTSDVLMYFKDLERMKLLSFTRLDPSAARRRRPPIELQ